jgi:hypothetical protein
VKREASEYLPLRRTEEKTSRMERTTMKSDEVEGKR